MRKTFLVIAAASVALSGCTTMQSMSTGEKIDAACETAVLIAQATGTVADIAAQHGADRATAQQLALKAANGEDIVSAICTVGHIFTPGL